MTDLDEVRDRLSADNVCVGMVIRWASHRHVYQPYRIDALAKDRHIAVTGLLSGRATRIDWHSLPRYTIVRPK